MKKLAVVAIAVCGTVGLTAAPALAKTKSSDPVSIQKQKADTAAKSCERGAVAPFKLHPGHKNRGFLKDKC